MQHGRSRLRTKSVNAEASTRGTVRECDRVVLTASVCNERLEVGDVGIVVHVYADGKVYEIEFTTLDGQTRDGRHRRGIGRSACHRLGHFAFATLAEFVIRGMSEIVNGRRSILGEEKPSLLFDRQPVSDAQAQPPDTLDAPDASREFRAEEPRIGGLGRRTRRSRGCTSVDRWPTRGCLGRRTSRVPSRGGPGCVSGPSSCGTSASATAPCRRR